ncbi:hypothetical protein LR69_03895 [Geobacillus sp. BCO2]|nr:hypothetical protein LR69_03895 [Geobacillus sp. BCO2]
MLSLTWIEELQAFLHPEQIKRNESFHPLGNDGAVAVYPRTEEEIAAVLRYADRHDKKVVIAGRGTKRGLAGNGNRRTSCCRLNSIPASSNMRPLI